MRTYARQQAQFKGEIGSIRQGKRIEVHILNMKSNPAVQSVDCRLHSQLTGVFSISNPLVDLIIVTPRPVPEDIQSYYHRIVEIGGTKDPKNRVTFYSPEPCLGLALMTSTLVYLSQKALNFLNSKTRATPSYLVPTEISLFDIKISVALGIPIYSSEISNNFSTKSGACKIFQLSGVPTPAYATSINSPSEFFLKLAELIKQNIWTDRWILKIDDEREGRGLAYLNIQSLQVVSDIRKYGEHSSTFELPQIITSLQGTIKELVRFVMPSMYKDWEHYLGEFCRRGGLIQRTLKNRATDLGVTMSIDPDGFTQLISACELVQSREYLNTGALFPAKSLGQNALLRVCRAISSALFQKGIFGHIYIQLVVFPPAAEHSLAEYWGVDISLNYNHISGGFFYFTTLLGGHYDLYSGNYYSPVQSSGKEHKRSTRDALNIHSEPTPTNPEFLDLIRYETREFLYHWEIHHPPLRNYEIRSFLEICRLRNISFNLESATGTAFNFYTLLTTERLGLMTIGEYRKDCVNLMNKAFGFLLSNVGPLALPIVQYQDSPREDRPLSETIAKVKSMSKRLHVRKPRDFVQRI